MERGDLQRLSKDELIDLVLRLQRPEKTSRTSSKPPATDRKERRDKAKPGGAKPGHEGKARTMSEAFDRQVDHRPGQCPCCQAKLSDALPAGTTGEYERIELPDIHPVVERHRRLSVRCPSCGTLVVAEMPNAATGTPFGPRIHAVATYLKIFQALSMTDGIETFAASTIAAKRRALERSLADILVAPTTCDLARDLQMKFRRARDKLLTFAAYLGLVEPTNNGCERALRPAVIQRKVANGYRAMWAAEGEAAIRTIVNTARLFSGTNTSQTIFKTVGV